VGAGLAGADREDGVEQEHTLSCPCLEVAVVGDGASGVVVELAEHVPERWRKRHAGSDGKGEAVGLPWLVVRILAEQDRADAPERREAQGLEDFGRRRIDLSPPCLEGQESLEAVKVWTFLLRPECGPATWNGGQDRGQRLDRDGWASAEDVARESLGDELPRGQEIVVIERGQVWRVVGQLPRTTAASGPGQDEAVGAKVHTRYAHVPPERLAVRERAGQAGELEELGQDLGIRGGHALGQEVRPLRPQDRQPNSRSPGYLPGDLAFERIRHAILVMRGKGAAIVITAPPPE
jgi:hypothetical protein